MLRTRILTAAVLACILLAGLFLLPAAWAVLGVRRGIRHRRLGVGRVRRPARRHVASRLCGGGGAAAAARLALDRRSGAPFAAAGGGLRVVGDRLAVAVLGARAASSGAGAAVRAAGVGAGIRRLARLDVSSAGLTRGPQLVLWLVLLVIAADIGAYFAGRSLGRRKLAPRVSPGKTWEGALGGLAHGGAGGLVGRRCILRCRCHPAVAFGCAVGIFSIVGDLTESMFKRAAGLKDSGRLLPGHGGLLDRIDSVTAAAPLYALGLFGSGVIP